MAPTPPGGLNAPWAFVYLSAHQSRGLERLSRGEGEMELCRQALVAAILMPVNSLLTLAIVTGGMRPAFSPRSFALAGK